MTTEPENNENDVVDELTGQWLDAELSESDSVESTEQARISLNDEQVRRAAQLQLVHSLLLHLADRDQAAKDRRIKDLMQKLEDRNQATRKFYHFARPLIRYAAAAAILIAAVILFTQLPSNTAMAAIDQMIIAIDKAGDRTYSITLKQNRRDSQPPATIRYPESEGLIPERAVLDGATLYLRGSDKFVLVQKTPSGKTVISGSDGQTRWHIRPDKPVLVSNNPEAFRIPMPPELSAILSLDLKDTLIHIRDNYKVKYLTDISSDQEPNASRKYLDASKISRDFPGPKNIEIWADSETGLLLRIEFADIRLEGDPSLKRLMIELVDQKALPVDWFTRQAHHPKDAEVDFISE